MSRIKMSGAKSGRAKSAGSKLPFSAAFEEFLTDAAARGLADKTLYTYRNHLHCVSLHLDIDTPLSRLTKEQLNEMVVSMRDAKLSASTISSYTRVVKTFLHWCQQRGYCNLEIPQYKAMETVKETYSDDELQRLLQRPTDCRFSVYRTWVLINFFVNAGCRAATIRNIKNCDVDLESQQVISRHNKNGKVQVIPLRHQMVVILREYMGIRCGAAEDYLFCNELGEQLSENALRLAVARYNQARGVQKTSIHLFRHTFARKYLVDCGGNAFSLQRILGHSTLKMTKHYCAIFDADIARNYDTFSPLTQTKANSEKIKMTTRRR